MKYHESCPISPSVEAAAFGYTNKVKTRLQQIGSYLRVNVGWWLTESIILMAADIIDNMIYEKGKKLSKYAICFLVYLKYH